MTVILSVLVVIVLYNVAYFLGNATSPAPRAHDFVVVSIMATTAVALFDKKATDWLLLALLPVFFVFAKYSFWLIRKIYFKLR